ncbi:hypothetical protein [Viridibacterium curvum]|uniref:Uncharacterized protein n=1 Tax=Viridibacterium curvum TaxID=1101404 RepID=A0ABP9QTX0_9RHOO
MRIPFIASLLGLLPLACHADVDFGGHISLGLQRENVQEFGTQDNHLLTEHGRLPLINAALELTAERLRVQFALRHARGELHYDGKTSAGTSVSSETRYRETRTGFIAALRSYAELEALLGVEQEDRYRDIQGVGSVRGLTERYRFRWLAAGLGWRHDGKRGPWQVSALWLRSFSSRQSVESAGYIDYNSFEGGRLRGYRFEALLPVTRAGKVSFALQPGFEYFDIARSADVPWYRNGVLNGSIAQPETHRWTASLMLAASW